MVFKLVPQPLVLFLQAKQVKGFFHDHDQFITTEGFGQIVIGTLLHSFNSFFYRAVSSNDNDDGFRSRSFDLLQDFVP